LVEFEDWLFSDLARVFVGSGRFDMDLLFEHLKGSYFRDITYNFYLTLFFLNLLLQQ
jgi:hypothetical protein